IESRKLFDAGGGSDRLVLQAKARTQAGALVDNLTQAAGLQTEQFDEGAFVLGDGNNSVVARAQALSEATAGASEGVDYRPSTFAFGITQMTADANNITAGEQASLTSGNGTDHLSGKAEAIGRTDVAAYGVLFEQAQTGRGNDTVEGSATAKSEDIAIASGISVGLAEDVSLADNSVGTTFGLGAEAGELDTGAENDTLKARAKTIALRSATARGLDGANGAIQLRGGRDAIVANATAQVTSDDGDAEAVGIFGARIATGGDNDIIRAAAKILAVQGSTAKTTSSERGAPSQISVGIFGGSIATGDGNDRIATSSNQNLVGTSGIRLSGGQGLGGDVDLDLGTGNDALRGFGQATATGGEGVDTLLFDFSLRTFIAGGGSVSISGFDVDFSFAGVTLSTRQFERFRFGSASGKGNQVLNSPSALQKAVEQLEIGATIA
ncbi:MAG: hypothetical protein AAF974_10945, partial [Cyanobacteria bacterium P01_E01_bin.34]